jgi:hypothetical protein
MTLEKVKVSHDPQHMASCAITEEIFHLAYVMKSELKSTSCVVPMCYFGIHQINHGSKWMRPLAINMSCAIAFSLNQNVKSKK